jgi:hypothetical protein
MADKSKVEQHQACLFEYDWWNLENNKLSEHELIQFMLCEFKTMD